MAITMFDSTLKWEGKRQRPYFSNNSGEQVGEKNSVFSCDNASAT